MGNIITFFYNKLIIKEKEDNVSELLLKLENDGYDKLKELDTSISRENPEMMQTKLMNIISTGANEFKEKLGRPMTYAEMRSAYG